MRGGARPGAGRPVGTTRAATKEPTTAVTLRLTEAQRLRFLEIGGTRWLRNYLSEPEGEPGAVLSV